MPDAHFVRILCEIIGLILIAEKGGGDVPEALVRFQAQRSQTRGFRLVDLDAWSSEWEYTSRQEEK